MSKKNQELTCTVEFTEGAIDRITKAFVDLYYDIQAGIHTFNGDLPGLNESNESKDKPA